MIRTVLDVNDIPRDRPLYLVGYPEVMQAVALNLKSNYIFNIRAEVDAFTTRPNYTFLNYAPDFRYFMRSFDGEGLLLICTRDYHDVLERISEYGQFECLNLWRYYREVARAPSAGSWKTLSDYCLGPGAVVFDVGANDGVVSRFFAERAQTVYAFEPNKDLEARFRANTVGQGNIHLVQRTLSDGVGEHDFFVYEPKGGTAYGSSMDEKSDYLEKRRVSMTSIDAFCEEEDIIPDFIKIDTEGHEPQVLEGGTRIISQFAPTILFEYCEDTWGQLEATMRKLSERYGLYRVDDGCRALEYYESLADLKDRTIRPSIDSVTNILCIAKRKPRRLSQFRSMESNAANLFLSQSRYARRSQL